MHLFKKGAVIASLLAFQFLVVVFGAAAALDAVYSGLIHQGVVTGGVDVGGLSTGEAAEKLKRSLPPLAGAVVVIEGEGRSASVELAAIDGGYDIEGMTAAGLDYGRKSRGTGRLLHILRLRAGQKDLPPIFSCNPEKLKEKILSIKAGWDTPAENATVLEDGEKITIVPEKTGYELDAQATLERVLGALQSGQLNVRAAGRVLPPEVTAAHLAGVDSLLAAYTTIFDPQAANRAHNIALASSRLNGSVVAPGETFSFNRRLGPREEEDGYRLAPVFLEEGLGLDAGGGVCQVATTLYNAVLLAGLPVVERHPHPQPVAYAPQGSDATVAGDYLDLKFYNNTSAPIYIASRTEGESITVCLFGAGGRPPKIGRYPDTETQSNKGK